MGTARKYILECDWVRPSGITTVSGTTTYDITEAFSGNSIFNISGTSFSYSAITLTELGLISSVDYEKRVKDFLSYTSQFNYNYTLSGMTGLSGSSQYNEVLCVETTTTTLPLTTTTTTTTTPLNNYTISWGSGIWGSGSPISPSNESWIYPIVITPPVVIGDSINITLAFSLQTTGYTPSSTLILTSNIYENFGSDPNVGWNNKYSLPTDEWENYPSAINPTGGTFITSMNNGSERMYRLTGNAFGISGAQFKIDTELNLISAVGVSGNVGIVTINNTGISPINLSGTI